MVDTRRKKKMKVTTGRIWRKYIHVLRSYIILLFNYNNNNYNNDTIAHSFYSYDGIAY